MSTEEIQLHTAWDRYLATLSEVRKVVEDTPRYRDNPLHRAQAYDALFEAQAMAYNYAIGPRLDHPRVYSRSSWNTYLYTLGQNSPDCYYGAMFLDGRGTYRLSGRAGATRIFLMQVHTHLLGHPQSKGIGNYDLSNFTLAADGSFEIIVSAKEHPGNWIRLDPESDFNFIFIRRWLYDYFDDVGDLQVEPIGDMPAYDEQSMAQMAARIIRATDFLRYLVVDWSIALIDTYVRAAKGQVNAVALVPGEKILSDLAGSPSTIYGLGKFELSGDDALILETEIPDCVYWSVQLGDVWSQSLDFMHHQTDMNGAQAAIDSDGKCRMVICLDDPGIANWLDPVGRNQGTIVYRNYRSKTTGIGPAARLVKRAELDRHLPAGTARVTASQRQSRIARRRAGLIRRYGD
jgi:hypothetical protein